MQREVEEEAKTRSRADAATYDSDANAHSFITSKTFSCSFDHTSITRLEREASVRR